MKYPKNRKTPWKNNWRYNWRSYDNAKKFVHSLNLKSKSELIKFSKSKNRPIDIPTSPSGVYKNKGWIRWGDWLGNEDFYTQWKLNEIRKKIPFKTAHEFVLKLVSC